MDEEVKKIDRNQSTEAKKAGRTPFWHTLNRLTEKIRAYVDYEKPQESLQYSRRNSKNKSRKTKFGSMIRKTTSSLMSNKSSIDLKNNSRSNKSSTKIPFLSQIMNSKKPKNSKKSKKSKKRHQKSISLSSTKSSPSKGKLPGLAKATKSKDVQDPSHCSTIKLLPTQNNHIQSMPEIRKKDEPKNLGSGCFDNGDLKKIAAEGCKCGVDRRQHSECPEKNEIRREVNYGHLEKLSQPKVIPKKGKKSKKRKPMFPSISTAKSSVDQMKMNINLYSQRSTQLTKKSSPKNIKKSRHALKNSQEGRHFHIRAAKEFKNEFKKSEHPSLPLLSSNIQKVNIKTKKRGRNSEMTRGGRAIDKYIASYDASDGKVSSSKIHPFTYVQKRCLQDINDKCMKKFIMGLKKSKKKNRCKSQ
ncbi:unnamed protein product [Moneuplotes crassus]|uniref:Uncharacterized protein n=1 Tax=Euplotes crassus TaxID=5936 RepID=A0AAD1X7J8_EUPCR|nr:unnamed protein product [Moneuplotes crassus]